MINFEQFLFFCICTPWRSVDTVIAIAQIWEIAPLKNSIKDRSPTFSSSFYLFATRSNVDYGVYRILFPATLPQTSAILYARLRRDAKRLKKN